MGNNREALAEALEAWRAAEHALAQSNDSNRADLEVETGRLRARYQQLSAATVAGIQAQPPADDEVSRPPS